MFVYNIIERNLLDLMFTIQHYSLRKNLIYTINMQFKKPKYDSTLHAIIKVNFFKKLNNNLKNLIILKRV